MHDSRTRWHESTLKPSTFGPVPSTGSHAGACSLGLIAQVNEMNEDELNQEWLGLNETEQLEAGPRAVAEPVGVVDAPDLVEDEVTIAAPDAAPRVKRLVWSRELRGWMAGMSVVVIAMAAIAPAIDLPNLEGAATIPSSVEPGSNGPACQKAEDDGGMGGSTVSCRYDCYRDDVISIAVHASDKDAGTLGNTVCGAAEASCNSPTVECVGNSLPEKAQTKQMGATCKGESDEFWDSPVSVGCVAAGTSVERACDILKISCGERLRQLCLDAFPILGRLDDALLDFLFPAVEGAIHSLVGASVADGIWVAFDGEECQAGLL